MTTTSVDMLRSCQDNNAATYIASPTDHTILQITR